MGRKIFYEKVADLAEVPPAMAHGVGWVQCADAGSWLRRLPDDTVVIVDREAAVERMAQFEDAVFMSGQSYLWVGDKKEWLGYLLDAAHNSCLFRERMSHLSDGQVGEEQR